MCGSLVAMTTTVSCKLILMIDGWLTWRFVAVAKAPVGERVGRRTRNFTSVSHQFVSRANASRIDRQVRILW